MSERERSRLKFLARQAEDQKRQASLRALARVSSFKRRPKVASREEQHARYLDCGPQAWDA